MCVSVSVYLCVCLCVHVSMSSCPCLCVSLGLCLCVCTHVSGSLQVLEGLQHPKDADLEWLISDSWEMLSDPEPGDENEWGY